MSSMRIRMINAKQLLNNSKCILNIGKNTSVLFCHRSNILHRNLRTLSCTLNSKKTIPNFSNLCLSCQNEFDFVNKCLFTCKTTVCQYSSKANESSVGITDEIMKSKLHQEQPTTDDQGKTKDEDANENDKKKSSWFSSQNAWKLGLISLTGMGILTGCNLLLVWGAPMLDQDGNEIVDEFTSLPKWKGYMLRAKKEFYYYKKMIQEPSSKKLLPDPLKEPYYQPPYTLVLEMTGVLVHPDWTLNTGWRFKKRPGIDYFLQQVGPPIFEVVIFTHEQGMTAYPIVDGIDPKGYIAYRLFRDATKWQDGSHIKDLECLNRDLSKVIVVDCDPQSVKLQPRNAIPMKKWKGEDDDRKLMDLASFLRTIAASNVEDVRNVLDYYNQFDDPLEAFKENQRKLQEEQSRAVKTTSEQSNKNLTSSWAASLTGRRR